MLSKRLYPTSSFHRLGHIAVTLCAATLVSGTALAAPKVVVSIPPIHGLVSGVMKDVGTPHLLVQSGESPHTYSLRPSGARALSEADLVVWVGEGLESFLANSLDSLAPDAAHLELLEAEGIKRLPNRGWEEASMLENALDHSHGDHGHGDHHDEDDHDEHSHDEHDHDEHGHDEHGHDAHGHDAHDEDHDEHAHDDHDDHAHKDEHGHDDHGHGDHGHSEKSVHMDHAGHDHGDGHDHGLYDPHIWLSVTNAISITNTIAETLANMDPDNALIYQQNAQRQVTNLESLKQGLSHLLEPVHNNAFMVFHDAYQYLEADFDLNNAGAIHADPSVAPSAGHLRLLRRDIVSKSVRCVLTEPQFPTALISSLTEGLSLHTMEIDPLGLVQGPPETHYQSMMETIGLNLSACLHG